MPTIGDNDRLTLSGYLLAAAVMVGVLCGAASVPAATTTIFDVGATGSNVDAISPGTIANVTISALTRGPGLTHESYFDGFSGHFHGSKDWTTSATRDAGDYMQFSITPFAGCDVTYTSLSYSLLIQDALNSTYRGPRKWELRYSTDGFASVDTLLATHNMTALYTGSKNLIQVPFTVDISPVGTQAGTVTFRWYGYDTTGSSTGSFAGVSNSANGPTSDGFSWSGTGGNVVLDATVTVNSTTTTLTSSANPSLPGQSVACTATVFPPPTGGTVEFRADGTTITGCGGQALSGGQATCTTSALALGSHTMTALYSGTTGYPASDNTASPLIQVVCVSAITVTTNADSGAGSLRQAIAEVCVGGTIDFAADTTITLASELVIGKSLTITGSGRSIVVSGNHASRVFNTSGDNVVISGLTIRDGFNNASPSSPPACFGAGVYNSGPDSSHLKTLTLSNCTITNNVNQNGYGGGVLTNQWGVLNLINCTVSNNSAPAFWGGGLNVRRATANVTNCTFTGNTASIGGGVTNEDGVIVAVNSTFSGNSATAGSGGGGNIFNGSTVSITRVHNNLVANSVSGGNCGGIANVAAVGGNNFDDDGTCDPILGHFTQSSGILLGPLGSNGGPTQTIPLMPGSVAIDAGDDAVCAATPVNGLDQRGIARPQGAHCDSGAFESQGFTLSPTGGDNQATHVNTAFANPLALTVSSASSEPVNGGVVTFTGPSSGAGTIPVTFTAPIVGGAASAIATANATVGGPYTVAASASGAAPVGFSLTNTPPLEAPTITSASATTFTVGSAGTFTVTATGNPAPSLSLAGSLPSGVTFTAATGVLAGTPAAGTGGSYPLTITAANGVAPDASQSFTLTVNQAPAITSPIATTFTVGAAGTFTVTATGNPAPSLSLAGSLPSGVTFTAATGVLAGTPAAGTGGSYPLTITAANGVSPNATQPFTLTVNEAPAITSANTTTFTVGSAGTFTVTATGNPAPTLSLTGSLPSGVTFTAATGVLAGTPAAGTGGSYPLTITAANGVAPDASQSFTLTVNQAPAITSATATTFAVGSAGTFTVTATGNPAPTLSLTGSLPSGVTFTAATGVLTGTPAAGTGGSYPLTFTAANGVAPDASQSFTLTVNQAPAITSASATTFTVGAAGTFTVTATGNPAPSLSLTGSLPSGVTFTAATGVLAGTPAAGTGGSYPLTVTAANGVAPDASQSFTLTVNQAPAITSSDSTAFAIGVPGSFTFTTSGTPTPTITFSGALPDAVTLVANGDGTATLSGTPATGTAGAYPLTITASNGVSPEATQSFTLNVGQIHATPGSVNMRVPIYSQGQRTLTLTNDSPLSVGYTFVERPHEYVWARPAITGHTWQVEASHASDRTALAVPEPPLPDHPVELLAPAQVLDFDTGLSWPWGIGLDTLASRLFIGDEDNINYGFSLAGIANGETIDTTSWCPLPQWGADMTYDPYSQKLWQLNIGGDTCIHEMDAVTLTSTGVSICPAWGTSYQGLAFDPVTDTFFAGSWNDGQIRRFNRAGSILETVATGLATSGLAYNPSTGHLFVLTNSAGPADLHVLDVTTSYRLVASFKLAGMGAYEQAGLDADCAGNLYAVNQSTSQVLVVASGEGGFCSFMDVPWLAETPPSGTIPAGGTQEVELSFITALQWPGLHRASLQVGGTAPFPGVDVPITYTIAFLDVPETHWADPFIHGLAGVRVTVGCGEGNFCPEQGVDRAMMAILLVRAMHGPDFSPQAATGIFVDVPINDTDRVADYVEQLYRDGVVAGCAMDAEGNRYYCPDAMVSRAQMAVFVAAGSGIAPVDPPTGYFTDVHGTIYAWAEGYIEAIFNAGITAGCDNHAFCPGDTIPRAQLAVWLVSAFGFPYLPPSS